MQGLKRMVKTQVKTTLLKRNIISHGKNARLKSRAKNVKLKPHTKNARPKSHFKMLV
jgi:hypothetical protein